MSFSLENWQRAGFGLYIHWPFCQAKCPYCDFNSYVTKSVDETAWADAYLSEIARVGAETSDRTLSSVFFGGGTPSLMSGSLVEKILDKVRTTWRVANDIEITLEANPTSVEAKRFDEYAAAGVNRVSIGVQALHDPDLVKLGRLHSVSEALKAIEAARKVFPRVSFDLIYARQNQTLAEWENELLSALRMQPDHVSLYQLTIEDGTAFGDRAKIGKLPGLPDEDLAADMYIATQKICADAGLPAYEISNHAAPGQESKHNLIYWNGGDYVGIGPGAHGRLTFNNLRYATETSLGPTAWLQSIEPSKGGEIVRDVLSEAAEAEEFMMMGLRLSRGVDNRMIENRYKFLSNKINKLLKIGYLEKLNDQIYLPQKYRPVLNAVLRELFA